MRADLRWLALLAPSAVVGCQPDARVGGAVAVRDSAGITIVENAAPDPSRALSVVLQLEVGVVEGDPEHQLFQVSDVTRLSDGSVVIANEGSSDVRVFEADGTHRVSFGRPGQGPREFRYPMAVGTLPGDTIVVQDRWDRVWWTSEGRFVRRATTSYADLQALMPEGRGSEGGLWLADGTLLAPVYEFGASGPPQPGPPYRPEITLVRVDAAMTSLDTLGVYGGIGQQPVDVGGGRVRHVVPPFSTNTSWAPGPEGLVAVGDNAAPSVDLFHADGHRTIVRWRAEAESLSSDEVSDWLDAQRSASWTRGQLPQLERAWAAMDIPETKAYYGAIGLGVDGSLWVAASADWGADPAVFMVFEPDGAFEGFATVPGRFRWVDAGDGWMAGVHYDEQDVEFVRLYQIGEPVH